MASSAPRGRQMGPGCWLALCVALGSLGGCREQSPQKPRVDPLTQAAAQVASAQASARAEAGIVPGKAQVADEPPEQPSAATSAAAPANGMLGELFDVGPAGPATATAAGIVMVTKSDAVVVAALRQPKGAKSNPAGVKFDQVTPAAEEFFPYAAGPAVLGSQAYFIANGQLVRRPLSGEGKVEVLATDGRTGARVAVAPAAAAGTPATVAYVAQQGDELYAQLWVEGAGTHRLSPDGTAANSVAMARHSSGLMVLALEGRTSMSPVHARPITFQGTKPKIGEDVVVWVAGTAQQLTELHAVGTGGALVWAFLPIERDMTHYGLARVHVAVPPRTNADVSWRAYPNGLDPAPADCAHICGQPMVAYVRPSDKAPRSPQELHLAAVTEDGLGPSDVVARSRAFANISIAPIPGGAVLAYVADRRTWARTIACPGSAKQQRGSAGR